MVGGTTTLQKVKPEPLGLALQIAASGYQQRRMTFKRGALVWSLLSVLFVFVRGH